MTEVALSVPRFSLALIDLPQMSAQGLSKQRGAIRLQFANRPIGSPQQIGLENHLDGCHMWNLLHIGVNSQRVDVGSGKRGEVGSALAVSGEEDLAGRLGRTRDDVHLVDLNPRLVVALFDQGSSPSQIF